MTNDDYNALSETVTRAMARLGVPGVAVGLWHDGKLHTSGYGVTSVENPLPITADTLFQIGSTTKTFTGTALMRLTEAGTVELDKPVRAYLPDFRLSDESAACAATVRQLLTHTGGWVGDYFEDFGAGEDAIARYVASMKDLPQVTPPGAHWSYNNAAFWVAGRIVEVVTGKPWETALRDLLLAPLGMTRTFFFADDVITHRFAAGHHVRDGAARVARRWSFPRRRPSGSIISTVKDQMRYARFHLGDGRARGGERLLSARSLAAMREPLFPRDLGGMMQGVTWMLRTVGGETIVQHGGATNGQMSAFLFVPARDFALTVLTNADRGAALHREVTAWALDRFLGLRAPAPVPHELPPDRLAEYAGRYETPATDLNIALPDIEIRAGDGILHAEFIPRGGYPTRESPQPGPPPARLAFCAPDRVLALEDDARDDPADFLRDASGRIRWLRYEGRIRPRVS